MIIMKIEFTLSILLMLFITNAGNTISIDINKTIINEKNGISRIECVYKIGGGSRKVKLYAVNLKEQKPSKIIWIFHGYKPEGDPYHQHPEIIIRNWDLTHLASIYHLIFILPDMGKTIYPLSAENSPVSDVRFLADIFNSFNTKPPEAPVIFAGISTGVEGAIKLASICSNVTTLLCLSGTYDYSIIPEESGEYKIHQEIFDNSSLLWKNENPVEILSKLKKTTLFIYCEENSQFNNQARNLIISHLTNIILKGDLNIGKGFKHGWDFWKSPAVLSNITAVFNSSND